MTDGSHQAWSDSPDEVARRLQTDLDSGLSDSTAEERLQIYGPNQLADGRCRSGLLPGQRYSIV